MEEAEASLRRTLQSAHAAPRSSYTVTSRLAAQSETLTALEERVEENEKGWRQGRGEMRRTRHWCVALVHWLRCGGGASLSQVAGKSPGVTPTAAKRLQGVTPVTDLSFCPPLKRELGRGN
ncbi:hypothetical protein CUR178_05742 [Leishmania enriettii]|uniref:Uncharacterized protein n=1 Tax=Leishmania enriettii TaxID=5663 RepID=A0A836KP90_LEIEN|nr:hypothetical protein CUR178_05742 [Leishmania enriettii]